MTRPYRGSRIIPVRFEDELLNEVLAELSMKGSRKSGSKASLSSWIRQAVAEKLAHAKRSRGRRSSYMFVCADCGQTLPRESHAVDQRDLSGDVVAQYCCFCRP
jgi:hypothetical protein